VYEDAKQQAKLSQDLAYAQRDLERETGDWMEAQEALEKLSG